MTIEIICQDITTLHVDAIVNAANSRLLAGGGVDGAIHQSAGPKLQEACNKLQGCEVGEAKLTPGFQLPAKCVIHTVGPVWHEGTRNEKVLLKNCYVNVFELAKTHNFHSIAFPAISTGIFGFPKKEAAIIALTVMQNYQHHFKKVIACLYSQEDKTHYEEIFTTLFR